MILRGAAFILRMMETALTKAPDFCCEECTGGMACIEEMPQTGEDELQAQIQKTGSAFAVDMLLLKFVQGFRLGYPWRRGNPSITTRSCAMCSSSIKNGTCWQVASRNGYSLRFL